MRPLGSFPNQGTDLGLQLAVIFTMNSDEIADVTTGIGAPGFLMYPSDLLAVLIDNAKDWTGFTDQQPNPYPAWTPICQVNYPLSQLCRSASALYRQ